MFLEIPTLKGSQPIMNYHAKCLFSFDRQAFTVAAEFGCVHALDFGETGLVGPAKLDARRILENVSPARQVVDEKVTGRVARRLIIGQSVLVSVLGQDIDRLRAAAAVIFHVNKLHVAIDSQFDSHHQLVADRDGIDHPPRRASDLCPVFFLTYKDFLSFSGVPS